LDLNFLKVIRCVIILSDGLRYIYVYSFVWSYIVIMSVKCTLIFIFIICWRYSNEIKNTDVDATCITKQILLYVMIFYDYGSTAFIFVWPEVVIVCAKDGVIRTRGTPW